MTTVLAYGGGTNSKALAIEWVRRGLPLPGKSACFYCPSSKTWEIRALAKNHPDLMARALAMEVNAKETLTQVKGLGRQWSWASFIDADERQGDLFNQPIDTPCGCYDGESAET